MQDENGGQLFDGVCISFAPTVENDSLQAEKIRDVVERQGGRHVPWPGGSLCADDLFAITHIVAAHADFPRYNDALAHGVHVVKPAWVIRSADRGKLANPRQYSPDPSQYFSDVVLCTGELPESDKDTIIGLVVALGGMYSGPLSKLVTHIVTTKPDDSKCQEVRSRGLEGKIKMVLPHWFEDCFGLGRRINEKPYMFPDPEILRNGHFKIRDVLCPSLAGALTATPDSLPDGTPPPSASKARAELNAFMSRKIMLSSDLMLGTHIKETLEALINYGGGTIASAVGDADIYIGQYRDGDGYIRASRAKKEVANLSWLIHVINANRYTNPLGKLCHYPIPRKPIPGFEHMRISISNYTGDARIYLENLIKYCGATFTKTMKQDNTHLITAHTQSEKYEAAQQWNINIVNHIWLEESYSKCAAQAMTNPRYTRFPVRTNLGEVVGQTSFDMTRMEQAYFPKAQEPLPTAALSSRHVTTSMTSPRKNNTLSAPVIRGTIIDPLEDDGDPPSSPAVDVQDDASVQTPSVSARPRGRPRKSVNAVHIRDDEKENDVPALSSSGRASKVKALDTLHQQADDIARYEKERRRKGGVTHGGRPSDHPEDFSSPMPAAKQRKKRMSDEATYHGTAEGSDLSDGETQEQAAKPAKKAKLAQATEAGPPLRYKMMVTGDERWLNDTAKESQDRIKLRRLGITLTQDAKEVDILVAPRILRTRKFVCALACAPLVVDSAYLDSALKNNKLIENPSPLCDRDGENRNGFKLADALERAKINQGKLLRGWSVFVTKDVAPGFDTYKEIITLNGGNAFLYQGRTGLTLPKRRLQDDPEAGLESQHQGGAEEFDYVYLVSGVDDADSKLWKTFQDVARKQNLKARIVKNDWLLRAAMSQEVTWNAGWDLTDEAVHPG